MYRTCFPKVEDIRGKELALLFPGSIAKGSSSKSGC